MVVYYKIKGRALGSAVGLHAARDYPAVNKITKPKVKLKRQIEIHVQLQRSRKVEDKELMFKTTKLYMVSLGSTEFVLSLSQRRTSGPTQFQTT